VLNGARIFLTYLREAQIICASALDHPLQDPGSCRISPDGCASSVAPVRPRSNYRRPIRDLLDTLGEVPSRWDVHQLRAFVLERNRTRAGPRPRRARRRCACSSDS
jgi:hypothetical protein